MVNIGVLISGNGTNLQAIIDGIDKGIINGRIKVVISNRKDAYGLTRASKANIESIYLDPKECDAITYDRKILHELKKRDVDLVVLAGYLRILSKKFIEEYKNRIINIHPSLIPSFCGKGYYGDRVHSAVLEYGVKYTGATVHFVDEGTDTGPIILQEVVKIDDHDTVDTLKEKVLEVEHKLLVQAIELFCQNKLSIKGRLVRIRSEENEKSID
ncbi:MAG: phosphoribosylglycinamide formyltransferase [Clostridiales bacterium]|nr:phosphoribosylglycinamide formyltransferase [Clostridiales bacterium]